MPVLLLAAALACAAQAPDAALTLVFQPVAGNEPLVLDAPRHRNAAGETWSVSRLSYLVSGVSLQRADAGSVEFGHLGIAATTRVGNADVPLFSAFARPHHGETPESMRAIEC